MMGKHKELNLSDEYTLWGRPTMEKVLGVKTTALYRAMKKDGP